MAGHGGLCQRIFPFRCEPTAVGCFCALLLAHISFAPLPLRAAQGESVDARFRLEWKSIEAYHWKLQVDLAGDATSTTSIEEVTNLSDSETTSGAIEVTPDAGSMTIQPRHALSDGAVQFRLRGPRQARVSIKAVTYRHRQDSSISRLPNTEISLGELVQQQTISSATNEVNSSTDPAKWTLTRVENDTLRMEDLPTASALEPNSELRFSVRCNSMVDQLSRQLTLHTAIIRVTDEVTVSSHQYPITVDARGNSEPVKINEVVPSLGGVYEIRCQLFSIDDNIWSRLRRREPPVMRIGRPIVVQSANDQLDAEESTAWESIGEIRPSENSWSVGQWIPQSTSMLIPGSQPEQPKLDLPSEPYLGETISLIQPGNTIQAKLPVLSPGLPHRITIRFPDHRPIRLRVDVAPPNERDRIAASFVLTHRPEPGQETGWGSHRFVYYPRAGEQIWLSNVGQEPAAFESISVHAGPDRLSGATTPAGTQRQAVLRLVDRQWVDSLTTDIDAERFVTDFDPATIAMHKTWTAVGRVTDYVLASGMNGVMIPIDGAPGRWTPNAPLIVPREQSSVDDPTSVVLSMFDQTKLKVLLALRPTSLLSKPEAAIRKTPALAGELTRTHRGNSAQYNLLHPVIQDSLASWIADIEQRYSQFACFEAIALICDNGSHLEPLANPEEDPGTLARFAQSKGMPAAGAQQHRGWVTRQGKSIFDAWLQEETRKAYRKVAGGATTRPVLMVMRVAADEESNAKLLQLVAPPESSSAGHTRLLPARAIRYGSDQVLAEADWLQRQLSVLGPSSRDIVAAALLDAEPKMTADQPRRLHEDLIADLTRVLDQLDPQILVVDQRVLAGQLNEDLTSFFGALTSYPPSGIKLFPGPDPASQTVRVRSGTHDGLLYVSMISLVPWSDEVEVETSDSVQWVAIGQTEASRNVAIQQRGSNRVRVVVPPGKMIMLRSKTPVSHARVTSWSSRVNGGPETLKQIKQQVTQIVERIGALSEFAPYDVLTNGGFEQSGGMGLVGWLHAQHPPGCVRVDDKEHIEGTQSVLLTTNPAAATRTWIVSETIDPPASGRLSVSLACRGEMRNHAPPHRLKVSLEGTRNGQPIRYSEEFEVPRNGQWGSRAVVLEADGIDPRTVNSVRLTIDSLSGGRVWIDDVQLHNQFATEQERDELQSLAFLAVQGLQRGNLAPSGRLLQNHWARHLLTIQPAKRPKPLIEPEQPPQETPGMAERLRSWLPRPLRF